MINEISYPKLTINCRSQQTVRPYFQTQIVLGSVISPVSAEAAAVAGDAR